MMQPVMYPAWIILFLVLWSQAQSGEVSQRFNRALELQRAGSLEEAAEEYRRVVALAPNMVEAHANLGVVLAHSGRFDEAVTAYQTALRLAPSLKPVELNLGIAHYRAGQFDQAVNTLEGYLRSLPDSLQARQLLGLSLVELGRDRDATVHLEEAFKKQPEDAAVIYSLGLAYLRLRRPEASEMVNRLAEIPAGKPACHLLRGQSFLANQEYERAVQELSEAISLNADLPRLYYSLGLSQMKLGNHTQAMEAFQQELQRAPMDFSTHYYLAYTSESAGDVEQARSHLAYAMKLEPESSEANALLGKVLLTENKPQEALPVLELAVRRDPTDPNKRYLLARVYQRLGRRQEAERELAEVQRLKNDQLQRVTDYLKKLKDP
jgi:tetratricopeptide (TPR) repeat protein